MIMKWMLWFSKILTRRLPPQKLVDFAIDVLMQVLDHIPQEQRVDFLKNAVEKHLGTILHDLSREERATLMNSLLPLASREFPLNDLDFLTVFSSASEGM
ncbi:MAG: hypothetical protein ABFD29_09690 [Anaerolineaceae bacterium]